MSLTAAVICYLFNCKQEKMELLPVILTFLFLSEVNSLKKCCKEGNFDIELQSCIGETNNNSVDIFDGLNSDVTTEDFGLPECLEGNMKIFLLNQNNSYPEFMFQDGEIVVLSDHTFHDNFCIDNTNLLTQSVAIICQRNLKDICRYQPCLRKCCQVGQVSCID